MDWISWKHYLWLFMGGLMSCLCYLCLFVYITWCPTHIVLCFLFWLSPSCVPFSVLCTFLLENTEGTIKNEQSRETGNIGYTRRRRVHKTEKGTQDGEFRCLLWGYCQCRWYKIRDRSLYYLVGGGGEKWSLISEFLQIWQSTYKGSGEYWGIR
jgi:hypothetical protein